MTQSLSKCVAEKSRRFVIDGSEGISRNCSPAWSFERRGLNVGGIIKCVTSVATCKTAPIWLRSKSVLCRGNSISTSSSLSVSTKLDLKI